MFMSVKALCQLLLELAKNLATSMLTKTSATSVLTKTLATSLLTKTSAISVLTKTRVCKAQHMAETNHELASVLFTKKDATGKADVPELNQDASPMTSLSAVLLIV